MNEDLFKALIEDDSSVINDELAVVRDEILTNDIREFSMYIGPAETSSNETFLLRALRVQRVLREYLSSYFPRDEFFVQVEVCWRWNNRETQLGYIRLDIYR